MSTRSEVEDAARAAAWYRRRGYNPLPSREDVKGPALASYAEYWRAPLPERDYLASATANVQLVCGVAWGLVAVDLDGTAGVEAWEALQNYHGECPPTWTVVSGSGTGRHLYFRPAPGTEKVETGRVWGLWDTAGGAKKEGGWTSHEEIKIFGDESLIIAPPSTHVGTGRKYAFAPGLSPRELAEPALLPEWANALPRLGNLGGQAKARRVEQPAAIRGERSTKWRYDRWAVVEAIGDNMIGVAAGFGVEFRSTETNAAGYVTCYRFSGRGGGREDRPSASFHRARGTYQEFTDGFGPAMSIFDLGVYTGSYATWEECRDALGDRFKAKPRSLPMDANASKNPDPSTACAPARSN